MKMRGRTQTDLKFRDLDVAESSNQMARFHDLFRELAVNPTARFTNLPAEPTSSSPESDGPRTHRRPGTASAGSCSTPSTTAPGRSATRSYLATPSRRSAERCLAPATS
jgi:hypothetical protein